MVCDDCVAQAWTWDGKRLLVSHWPDSGESDLGLLDTATRQYQAILHENVAVPGTSDDRWLAFCTIPSDDPLHSNIFILPVHATGEAPKGEWIAVTVERTGNIWMLTE
jgi:hypothetical protein